MEARLCNHNLMLIFFFKIIPSILSFYASMKQPRQLTRENSSISQQVNLTLKTFTDLYDSIAAGLYINKISSILYRITMPNAPCKHLLVCS